MKKSIPFLLFIISINLSAQSSLSGLIQDPISAPVIFSNVVLYSSTDNSLVKVESTDEDGKFSFQGIEKGEYYIVSSYIGFDDYRSSKLVLSEKSLNIGTFQMIRSSVQLETAVVKAKRTLVEVKPDRMVFNIGGTINSAGDNVLGLLRKAPGVLVDNSNNISVLSRSGVLIYIDGKRLPLSDGDLTSYLSSLPAEQIDRIDIITNPGAKYEAEGNAGIIDIRLKRDKSHGINGSVSGSFNQGQLSTGNISSVGNYRNKQLNTFGTLGYNSGRSFSRMHFLNDQNDLRTNENQYLENDDSGFNYRWGADFFIGKNHTIGFLISGQKNETNNISENSSEISLLSNPADIDSVLLADNSSLQNRDGTTYNINYTFSKNTSSLNFDIDYGKYRNEGTFIQPNRYFDVSTTELLSEVLTEYDTQVDIDIYTAKVDYETDLSGGRLGLGSKLSKVETDNTFLFYNIKDRQRALNVERSNDFLYNEKVYASYANYQKSLNQNFNFSAGLRVEHTDVTGELKTFQIDMSEQFVDLDYTNLFPSAGLTYNFAPNKTWSLNFGRRINRPDYNFLNPFTFQYSELSFLKGNENLKPEIVNNIELGYTLNYRYNFKLSYSKTTNQITRLVQPDDLDLRANLITWENLAEQTLLGFNISAPFGVTDWWNSYINFSSGYMNNQADYGDGAIVDVEAFTYSIFQQHTFILPKGYTGEISGWFAGPGIWGGVFEYDTSYSLNIGLQKKFFNDMMTVKLSASDITYQSGWSGTSNYDGLVGEREGVWDSRRVALSVGYDFGNSNVKSRQRSTGIEAETKRVGSN